MNRLNFGTIEISTGSIASRGSKESFRGHIASDTLGKTLATALPRGRQFFL